jgi:hypothetical protein
VTLFTAGMQTLTAQDTASGSLTGSSTIAVSAAPANHFLITALPTAISGVSFDVTVAALDPYGNVDTDYVGTVTFTSSDSDRGVVLPADYTFQSTDSGTHSFTAGVTLLTPGDQTLTATATADRTLTGSTTVTIAPGPVPPPGSAAGRKSLGQAVAVVDRLFASVREQPWLMAGYQRDRSADELFLTIGEAVV